MSLNFIAIDTETADFCLKNEDGSLDPTRGTPDRAWTRLIQINVNGTGAVYYDRLDPAGWAIGIERLKTLAADPSFEWVAQNWSYDLPFLWKLGVFPTRLFDTKIAYEICHAGFPGLRSSLDQIMLAMVRINPYNEILRPELDQERLCKLAAWTAYDLAPFGDPPLNPAQIDQWHSATLERTKKRLQLSDWGSPTLTPQQLTYALTDVGKEFVDTYLALGRMMRQEGHLRTFGLEMDALPAFVRMTAHGLKFNMDKWRTFIDDQKTALDLIETEEKLLVDEYMQQEFPERYMITLRRKQPKEGKPARIAKDGRVIREEVLPQTLGDLFAIQPTPRLIPFNTVTKHLLSQEDPANDLRVGYLVRSEMGLIPGETFNLTSAQQMRELTDVLVRNYDPSEKNTKFDDEEVTMLMELAETNGFDECVSLLKLHQQAQEFRKLISTYGERFWRWADTGGYIHSSFSQTRTDTGRVSSYEPNVQNIPRSLQSLTWSCEEGEVLIKADYSSQEGRVAMYITGQMDVYNAMLDGLDLHSMSASIASGIPYDTIVDKRPGKHKVKPQYEGLRTQSKAVTFAPLYGCTANKLVTQMGWTHKKAKKFMSDYWSKYAMVKKTMDSQAKTAYSNLYVTDLSWGRKRYFGTTGEQLAELAQGKTYEEVCYGWRNQAYNYAMQSSGASMLKKALKLLDDWVEEHPEFGAVIRITVHDSIIMTCKAEHAQVVANVLKTTMGYAATIVIPGIEIPVDVDIISDHTAPAVFPLREQTKEVL